MSGPGNGGHRQSGRRAETWIYCFVAGAVARLGSGTVDVSNVYAVPGHRVDWAELAGVVGAFFPDRPLVGYERGAALAAALDGGFAPLGGLRVWVR